jgi:hypothetical protein
LTPQIRGATKSKEKADVSYFPVGKDRNARPAGQFDYDSDPEAAAAVLGELAGDIGLYYHPTVKSKADAEKLLRENPSEGLFLLRLEVHGQSEKPCLSVFSKNRCTHHIMLQDKRTKEFTLNTFPFTTRPTLLAGTTA